MNHEFKMTYRFILALAISSVTAGCLTAASLIGDQAGADAITDDLLKERAAQNLGVSARAVKITNRVEKGVETRFNATVGGKTHACYVTSGYSLLSGRDVSDAICGRGAKATGAKKGNQSCNDLLRAAGKCD